MKIVILGGPLTGKTTLLRELEKKGIRTFQPDWFIAKGYEKNGVIYNKIKEEFGDKFLDDFAVNRQKLAKAVYEDRKLIKKLEDIINPLIEKEINIDQPIIIEASGAKIDKPKKIILVTANKDSLLKRYEEHLPHLDKEYVSELIDKWDNNINSDLIVDTSDDLKKEDVEKVLSLIK